jgi:hypothetical protein
MLGLIYRYDGYKWCFEHLDRAIRIIASLLQKDRPPAEIIPFYAIEDVRWIALPATVERNDLCP